MNGLRAAALVLLCAVCCSPARAADSGPGQESGAWDVQRLVEYHRTTKCSLGVQDVVKLLYQSHFGVGHLVSDSAAALAFLAEELGRMDTADREEPLIERISTSDEMVRINLRPFRRLNLPPERLVKTMMYSVRETRADTALFYRELMDLLRLVRDGVLRFPLDETRRLADQMTGELRPVHHTPEYTRANRPAYRVVRREGARRLFLKGTP